MLYGLIGLILVILICGPQIWVRYVLSRYSKPIEEIPGSGGQLAQHLLSKFDLTDVKVERAEQVGDHYSPQDNAVRLSNDNFEGKSLTAIAVAAHEVGHAIQFNRKEPVSFLRRKYLPWAHLIQKAGVSVLMALPIVGAIVKIPHVVLLTGGIGLATMLISVLMYVAILPEEWDASFNKALPILKEGGYVPEEQLPAIRRILKACALTYVASALADVLSLWRWLALLRTAR